MLNRHARGSFRLGALEKASQPASRKTLWSCTEKPKALRKFLRLLNCSAFTLPGWFSYRNGSVPIRLSKGAPARPRRFTAPVMERYGLFRIWSHVLARPWSVKTSSKVLRRFTASVAAWVFKTVCCCVRSASARSNWKPRVARSCWSPAPGRLLAWAVLLRMLKTSVCAVGFS